MPSETSLRGTDLVGRVTVDDPKRPEPPEGEHDWTLIVQFRLTKAEAAASSEGIEQLLDPEKVVYWTPVFCYRCEQAYAEIATHPCVGEPGRYTPDGRPMWRLNGVWTADPWRHNR